MKRLLVLVSLFVLSCSGSGGGGGAPSTNNNDNNNQCTTNCTQNPPGEDLITETFAVPGETGWTKEKDLAANENGGQFGAGCQADAQGNVTSKLQIHPGLTVGSKYNIIDKSLTEGNPLAGVVQSDEITAINGINVELTHRLHEIQVKGYDPQTSDIDIVCKITAGKEACAQATRGLAARVNAEHIQAMIRNPGNLSIERGMKFKTTDSVGRVKSCSIGGTPTNPVTRQVGKLKIRSGATLTAYRMELVHTGDVTCDNTNLGPGTIRLIRFVTNDLPAPVFDYCGGLPAYDYAKLYIGNRVLQQYLTEFYPAK